MAENIDKMKSNVDLGIMQDFTRHLNKFSNALKLANENCAIIMQNPGFESEELTLKMNEMKKRLAELTERWQEISLQAENHINQRIDELQALEGSIRKELY